MVENKIPDKNNYLTHWLMTIVLILTILFIVPAGNSQSTSNWNNEITENGPDLCPYRTPQEWQQFLERSSLSQKWVETCEDSACDMVYYESVKTNIEQVFKNCKKFISQHPAIARCTHNMRKFVSAWMQQHDDISYGFTVDNSTYLSEQESSDKPQGMMVPPTAIVEALPDLSRVESAARMNGWKYLTHDSALGGFRTFVMISDPKRRFDQWMLLNLQEGQSSVKDGTPFSMIVVQKRDSNEKLLPKTRIHFRDYTITHPSHGYRLELNKLSNGKCYSCHTGGMRQLIARRTPILEAKPVRGEVGFSEKETTATPPDFAYNRLMEFNRRIRSYGPPDWDGKVIPENHGPMLGKAQGCMDCHDGKTRGALNVSTSHVQLFQKVLDELSMPPDTNSPRLLEKNQMKVPSFSANESKKLKKAYDVHEQLAREFENSRFPTLRKWFLEAPCK